MQLTKVDRQECRIIEQEVLKALVGVEKKLGIKFSRGGGSFTDTSYTMKLESSIVKDGEVLSKEAQFFKEYGGMYGFKKSDFGKTFSFRTRKFKITGLKSRKCKYRVFAENIKTGKVSLFTISDTLNLLGRK